MKYYVTPEEIAAGKITDVYFRRTEQTLKARGIHKRVVAEVIAKGLPEDWEWGILGGVEEAAELLAGLPVEARALPEGSAFYPWEPVLTVEGYYEEFGAYETAILGMLCQASGIMTVAARCKLAACERPVISFGARRVHPLIVPLAERCAYAGGCDGVSTVYAAELLGITPSGTMPHSLCLLMGSTAAAIIAFDEVIERGAPRVALVDTFGDEKFEAVAAAEAIGKRLDAVRLDTPGSRRGDFKRILEEVRWELDLRGFEKVKIFVSGGITEKTIQELNAYADGYGVGTRITAAPTVDFALDIVEVDGKPLAKRGKESGRKELVRCRKCGLRAVMPAMQFARRGSRRMPKCECGGTLEPILEPLVARGRRTGKPQTIEQIRDRVKAQAHFATIGPTEG